MVRIYFEIKGVFQYLTQTGEFSRDSRQAGTFRRTSREVARANRLYRTDRSIKSIYIAPVG
jgi:hypothetical protein